jgi:hypothetical protein
MRLRLKMRRVDDMEYELMVRKKQVCIASLQPTYTLPIRRKSVGPVPRLPLWDSLCVFVPAFQKETGEMR